MLKISNVIMLQHISAMETNFVYYL